MRVRYVNVKNKLAEHAGKLTSSELDNFTFYHPVSDVNFTLFVGPGFASVSCTGVNEKTQIKIDAAKTDRYENPVTFFIEVISM